LIDLLSGRPGQLLSETLLHFLWQGIVVALLLRLCDPLLRSVQSRYSASLVALLVMLALPLATYYQLSQRERSAALPQALPIEAAVTKHFDSLTLPAAADLVARWQPWLVGLWLIGVLLLAARLLLGYLATLWLRGDRRPLTTALATKVAWLGRRLGVTTRCRVYLSARVGEAIAVGCFKPLVLIPLAWASELPTSALEAIIAHELAHIRRWDLWATLLQRLAETLLFYHPAVWWLSRRLSLQRELCCDALAVSATRSPADYVLALEMIARRTSAPPLTLATAFLGGGKMNLLERVRHVLAGSPREGSAWWPAGLAALAAPLLAAIAIGGWSLLPGKVLADDDREVEVKTEVDDAAEETSGLMSLALRFLAAGEEGDEQAEAETVDEGEADGKYLELIIRTLKGGGSDDEEADDDDGDDDDSDDRIDIERAARIKKQRALAEQQVREVEEALERQLKKLKGAQKELAHKKTVKKGPADDFDLSEFRPETEREKRLLAVIKKLQAQIKEARSARVQKPEGKMLNKIVLEAEKSERAEKDATIARQRAAKEQLVQELRAKKDLDQKGAAEKEVYRRAFEEKKEAIREKEAALRKHQEAAAAQEKAALQKALSANEELQRREAQRAAEYEKLMQRVLQGANERPDHDSDAELQKLRQALKQRDVELQKALEALKRAHEEHGQERETENGKESRRDNEEDEEDAERNEEEQASR
jgi:beta-lactamase regulating signal transducer with metallopeptidase domain